MATDKMMASFGDREFTFQRVYLTVHGRSELDYLQSIRSGVLDKISGGHPETTGLGVMYFRKLEKNAALLSAALAGRPVDLVIDAPSTRKLHAPYFEAIRAAHPGAVDLGGRITKNAAVSSGTGASFEELLAACAFTGNLPDMTAIKAVVVVDDVFGTGRTSAVVIALLQPLVHPEATFTVVCPLVAPQKEATLADLDIKHTML